MTSSVAVGDAKYMNKLAGSRPIFPTTLHNYHAWPTFPFRMNRCQAILRLALRPTHDGTERENIPRTSCYFFVARSSEVIESDSAGPASADREW